MQPPGVATLLDGVGLDARRCADAWSASGCQAITARQVAVPTRLMAVAERLIQRLDAIGAGLGDDFAAGGLGVLAERAASLMLPRSGRGSCGGASRLIEAADGWLAVTLARPDDRQLLPAWLGVDADDRVVRSGAYPWAVVESRVAGRSVAEVVEMGRLLGLACSPVGEVTDRELVKSETLGAGPRRELRGLRVVNLASLWAGPLCADVLRRLGADVVCLESTTRPDGARATPHWFDAIHAGQRSVVIDFTTRSGLDMLRSLLRSADVVIEGSRPRALEQLGIEARAIVAEGQPVAWVSITGHGRAGELGMRVALGDDAAAAGGLVASSPDGPVFLADAVADPLTGLVAAAAIVDQVDSGERALIDVALSRSAAYTAHRHGDPIESAAKIAAPPQPRAPATAMMRAANAPDVLRNWS